MALLQGSICDTLAAAQLLRYGNDLGFRISLSVMLKEYTSGSCQENEVAHCCDSRNMVSAMAGLNHEIQYWKRLQSSQDYSECD